jgi:alanine racemase
MVLNQKQVFSAIIHHQLEPEIYSLKGLVPFENSKQKNFNIFRFILNLMGMHRLGFEESTIDELIALLKEIQLFK